MIIGIVGSEAAKFTKSSEQLAKDTIRRLLIPPEITAVSSGHCHLGGIDIFAEEIAKELGKFDPKYIFPPKSFDWRNGYKPRNIQIARASDIVYCITVDKYPKDYKGMTFHGCYHCGTSDHVKSGGCWTVKYAKYHDKEGSVIVIPTIEEN